MGEKTKNVESFILSISGQITLFFTGFVLTFVFSNMVNKECVNIIYDFIIVFFVISGKSQYVWHISRSPKRCKISNSTFQTEF